MNNLVYMSERRPLKLTRKEVSEARKNAIRNMIYFRNDTSLYGFGRNVYKGYHDTAEQLKEVFQTQKEQAL